MKINLKILRYWICTNCLLLSLNIINAQNGPSQYVVETIRAIENMLFSEGDAPLKSFAEERMKLDSDNSLTKTIATLREIRKSLENFNDDIAVEGETYGFRMIFSSPKGEKHLKVVLDETIQKIQHLELLKSTNSPLIKIDDNNLEKLFEDMEAEGMSGIIYLKKDGKLKIKKSFGMANRALKVPITSNTVFGIGSRPIDFTQAGIYLLVQEKKIRLQDKIGQYFNNVPTDKQSITIEHLMTGRSGFPDFFHKEEDWDPDLQWISREEAVRRLLSQKLLFAPGTDQRHSHGAFGMLAALIEKVTGMSYYGFLKKNFFDPAGMTRTGETGQRLGLSIEDFAEGGGPNIVGLPNITPNWGPTSWLIKGSGGMCSTLEDLLKFYELVRSGKVLNEKHNTIFRRGSVGMDGSDRGFELFSVYSPSRNTDVYLFINEVKNRSKMRQIIRALENYSMQK